MAEATTDVVGGPALCLANESVFEIFGGHPIANIERDANNNYPPISRWYSSDVKTLMKWPNEIMTLSLKCSVGMTGVEFKEVAPASATGLVPKVMRDEKYNQMLVQKVAFWKDMNFTRELCLFLKSRAPTKNNNLEVVKWKLPAAPPGNHEEGELKGYRYDANGIVLAHCWEAFVHGVKLCASSAVGSRPSKRKPREESSASFLLRRVLQVSAGSF